MTDTPSLRLLVADRDQAFVSLFGDRFGKLGGYEVHVESCPSGTDLLQRLYAQPYDLVFLDLGLPDMDPLEVLTRLSQTSLPLPIVALSRENDARPAVEAMKRGVMDHIMKEDFASLDLDGLVRRLLETFRLRRENAELIQINHMKNDFLATISHELRTPLTSILGLSEILLTGRMGPLVDKQVDSLKKVIEQSQNLARLINQLLDVQDMIQQRLRFDMRPLSVTEVAEAQARVLLPLFQQKKVRLQMDPGAERLLVTGDRESFEKVVEHVLLNALKFTPEGGEVRLRLRTLAPNSVHLAVADTGQGIPQEALPYVFQKFFHADQSLTRAYGGLGLGLAYCKHVVEGHGGRIWVESPGSGHGTVVNITVPRLMAGGDGSDPNLRSVLWVDDNTSLLELVEVGFSALPAGIKLVTARSGASGLQRANEMKPALIVLDIMMPDMNGLEVLSRLRANPETREIPVLVVTGYREAAEEALAHGATDFFLKPFRIPEMVEKVRQHLHLPPLAAEDGPSTPPRD